MDWKGYKSWPERKAEILALAADHTYAEVAAALGLSHNTIANYLFRMRAEGIVVKLKRKTRHVELDIIERNIEMMAALAAGETLEAIGTRYGVTRERVRQIGAKASVRSKRPQVTFIKKTERLAAKAKSQAEKAAYRQQIGEQMRDLVAAGMSINKAADSLGLTRGQIPTISKMMKLGAITQWGRWRKLKQK